MPTRGLIANNRFYYREYRHPWWGGHGKFAVLVSSRNGDPKWDRNYCDDDQWPTDQMPAGFPSGRDTEWDHAHLNVIVNNQILDRSPGQYIEDFGVYPNTEANNRRVGRLVDTPTPCHWPTGPLSILQHGVSRRFVVNVSGEPRCERVTCNDATLESESCEVPASDPIPFSCRVTDNNSGCSMARWCPNGTYVSSVTAACNLELGPVTDAQFEGVPFGFMEVVTPSETITDGVCTVLGQSIQMHDAIVTFPENEAFFTASCKEHDSTGGDCHIRGTFTCDRARKNIQ